jgi:uncharacterized protein YvpB
MKLHSKKRLFIIVTVCLLLIMGILGFTRETKKQVHVAPSATEAANQRKQSKETKKVLLDVPIENQFDEPALGNGCEVTSLSMLLNFYGYQTTKNQLAEQLTYVPVLNPDGTHGDPNDGFVGDISGGEWAMGAYVPVVAELAKKVVQEDYQVKTKKGASIKDIKKALDNGQPVWASVTIEFEVPDDNDFMIWTTQNGQVKVTPLNHACIVTGYDKDTIYVNDPYGIKDRAVLMADFQKIFTAMGGQMLTLE